MTPRYLNSILVSCLLLGLAVTAGTAYSQTQETITESDVNAMLNAVDRASRKGNIAVITSLEGRTRFY